MKHKLAALLMMGAGFAAASPAVISESPENAPALELSERMRGFLKHEMLALVEAGRAVEAALAKEDHAAVEFHASRMEKTFIRSEEVTTLDLRELEAVLGEDFVAQDKAFHASARALEAAAKAKDIKGQRIIFDDMLRACAACHAAYAPEATVLE